MVVAIDGAPVAPHVQAFADEINRRFGFTHLLTYPTHQPDQQHAIDCFGPGPNPQAKMLELAWWTTRDDVIDHFGIDYSIFNADPNTVGGEIWNRELKRAWRQMPDRGSPTQNHHDHVHVSFEKTGSSSPFGGPPSPIPILLHKEYEPMIVHAGEALPYPVPKGATSGLVSCQDFGKGPIRAAIVVGHGPKSFHAAFGDQEVVEVGVGTSKFPIGKDEDFFSVHNLDDKGRALTVGVEF